MNHDFITMYKTGSKGVMLLVIILFQLLQAGASEPGRVLDKRISLSIQGRTIPQILKIIEASEGIQFVYTVNHIPSNYEVNVNVKNQVLDKVLNSVLSRTCLGWKEIDGLIVIYPIPDIPVSSANRDIKQQINVVSIYDTVVSYKYDTIKNVIFDTLLITRHDTVVHEVFKEKDSSVRKLFVGLTVSGNIYMRNNSVFIDHFSDSNAYSETIKKPLTISTAFMYQRDKLFYSGGIGLSRYNLYGNYKYPTYISLYKDTTVYIEHKYEEYSIIGDEVVVYTASQWIDSTYAKLQDSLRVQQVYNDSRYRYYLKVPISIGYQLMNIKNIGVILKGGACFEMSLSENKDIQVTDRFTPIEYTRYHLTYFGGLTLNYRFTKRFNTSISYLYYNQTLDIFSNALPKRNIPRFDLQFGMCYTLKR